MTKPLFIMLTQQEADYVFYLLNDFVSEKAKLQAHLKTWDETIDREGHATYLGALHRRVINAFINPVDIEEGRTCHANPENGNRL